MGGTRIVKVQKVGDSLAVTIPADVARAIGIKRGDSVFIEVPAEGTVLFRKIHTIN